MLTSIRLFDSMDDTSWSKSEHDYLFANFCIIHNFPAFHLTLYLLWLSCIIIIHVRNLSALNGNFFFIVWLISVHNFKNMLDMFLKFPAKEFPR